MNAEDFVTYEQALKLKELGFEDKDTFYSYPNKDYSFQYYDLTRIYVKSKTLMLKSDRKCFPQYCIDAPTLAQAQKWLRLNKNAIVYPYIFEYFENIDDINARVSKAWTYALNIDSEDKTSDTYISRKYDTPEEALSGGITECLKLLAK